MWEGRSRGSIILSNVLIILNNMSMINILIQMRNMLLQMTRIVLQVMPPNTKSAEKCQLSQTIVSHQVRLIPKIIVIDSL